MYVEKKSALTSISKQTLLYKRTVGDYSVHCREKTELKDRLETENCPLQQQLKILNLREARTVFIEDK